jgi:hypothetical protein
MTEGAAGIATRSDGTAAAHETAAELQVRFQQGVNVSLQMLAAVVKHPSSIKINEAEEQFCILSSTPKSKLGLSTPVEAKKKEEPQFHKEQQH